MKNQNDHFNSDSILNSVKKQLGLDSEYPVFDNDILIHINSVFMILNQMGVDNRDTPYHITDSSDTWDDYLTGDTDIQAVKDYMYLKVKSIFDPPTSGAVSESLKNILQELEWRIYSSKEYSWKENTNG